MRGPRIWQLSRRARRFWRHRRSGEYRAQRRIRQGLGSREPAARRNVRPQVQQLPRSTLLWPYRSHASTEGGQPIFISAYDGRSGSDWRSIQDPFQARLWSVLTYGPDMIRFQEYIAPQQNGRLGAGGMPRPSAVASHDARARVADAEVIPCRAPVPVPPPTPLCRTTRRRTLMKLIVLPIALLTGAFAMQTTRGMAQVQQPVPGGATGANVFCIQAGDLTSGSFVATYLRRGAGTWNGTRRGVLSTMKKRDGMSRRSNFSIADARRRFYSTS